MYYVYCTLELGALTSDGCSVPWYGHNRPNQVICFVPIMTDEGLFGAKTY